MNRDRVNNKDVDSLNIKSEKFFDLNKDEEILLDLKKNFIDSIKGLFIYASLEKNLIMFYGNNKEILGCESQFVVINIKDINKYIDNKYIKLLIDGLKYDNEEIEIKIKNNDNKEIWVSIKGFTKKNNEGNIIEFEGYIHNINNEKEAKIKLEYVTLYDELTGLSNRRCFKSLMKEQLNEHALLENRGALIIIDIDNFKFINDSYGHDCGDVFLKIFSEDLKKEFNSNEVLCRFDGDEFIVFIPNISGLKKIKNCINKITNILKLPYLINNKYVFATVSIGVSVFPDDGEEIEGLIKNADAAIYVAKSNGKNQWQMFNNDISTEINRVYSIQRGLRTALENNEMFVMFQPKVRLIDNKVDGFEALLRWNSSEIGSVSPIDFIPVAESTRLIIPIGKFVLREVFVKIKYLLLKGYDNFKIAVNLSEIQLREGDLLGYIKSLVEEFKVSPKYIEFEITESMIMKSVDRNIEYLIDIKKLGISIALDDFGTGYSSLNYLTRLPIDVLKIDRSFVIDMVENDKSRCIIEEIIQLSHKLGINVVAEGVEEKQQIEYLRSIECDTVQGYYYSRPEKFENAIEMLNKFVN